MNIFNCDGKELVLLSALIADRIAAQYTAKEQELISVVLRSIAENITIYVATENINDLDDEF